MYVFGGHFSPVAARMSETKDGDGMREPENANRRELSTHGSILYGRETYREVLAVPQR
jgi:hypothetical protein